NRGRERFRCEQPPYSVLVRGIEAAVLPTCQKYGIGVIAWSPLAGGWLTGRYRKDTDIDMTTGRARRLPHRFDPALAGNQAKLAASGAHRSGRPPPPGVRPRARLSGRSRQRRMPRWDR